MISKSIVNAVLKAATKEAKDSVIRLLIDHMNNGYDYDDFKGSHVLECLVDNKAIVTKDDVNIEHIKSNLKCIMYGYEKYLIKDIKVERVDNIDCCIVISYSYKEKLNEEREDISYVNSHATIYWKDYPQVLKNS